MIRVDELQPGNVVYLGSRSPSNVIYVSAPLESGQGVTFMNGRRVPSPEHQNSRKIIKVLMLSTSGLCPIIPFYSDVTLETEPHEDNPDI